MNRGKSFCHGHSSENKGKYTQKTDSKIRYQGKEGKECVAIRLYFTKSTSQRQREIYVRKEKHKSKEKKENLRCSIAAHTMSHSPWKFIENEQKYRSDKLQRENRKRDKQYKIDFVKFVEKRK